MYSDTEEFGIAIGLHQRSALSPPLVVVVMDILSEAIGYEDISELLYVDDLVVVARSEEELKRRMLEWQECLEKGGLRVNVGKTRTMIASKGGGEQTAIVDTHGRQPRQVDSFKYHGTMVDNTRNRTGCEK